MQLRVWETDQLSKRTVHVCPALVLQILVVFVPFEMVYAFVGVGFGAEFHESLVVDPIYFGS